jgi:hypothetical protein
MMTLETECCSFYGHAECHYAECLYAGYQLVECNYEEYHFAECRIFIVFMMSVVMLRIIR